jgi:hypothetical protein
MSQLREVSEIMTLESGRRRSPNATSAGVTSTEVASRTDPQVCPDWNERGVAQGQSGIYPITPAGIAFPLAACRKRRCERRPHSASARRRFVRTQQSWRVAKSPHKLCVIAATLVQEICHEAICRRNQHAQEALEASALHCRKPLAAHESELAAAGAAKKPCCTTLVDPWRLATGYLRHEFHRRNGWQAATRPRRRGLRPTHRYVDRSCQSAKVRRARVNTSFPA